MSGALSKRQQARNEKILHELVISVPGNNCCADCQAHNPAWASWSLGVFLCMRCAAIHRKLGTHISKVKSLSMDSWSNEQVDNMRKVGNLTSNKIYNPQNKRPPVPIDADEADSAMERFIRSKYMDNTVASSKKQNAGKALREEGPPLPPKTPSRFGFRSASSIFPLSSRAKKANAANAAREPLPGGQGPQSPHRNKPSQVFGASVHIDGAEDIENKLARLRDMGFHDDQRNVIVLKGVNGSLEKTIETLVRLGEGDRHSQLSLPPSRDSSLPANRTLTPTTPINGGLSLSSKRSPATSAASDNPFDMLDMPPAPAQPQSSQSTGTLQNKNPFMSTNPFGVSVQQAEQALDQAFQNMSLAPSQPLFPNRTGGVPASQQNQPAMYQQSLTPPVPSTQNGFPNMSFQNYQTYPPPSQPAQTGYNHNPFFTSQPQPQPQSPPQPQPQPSLTVNTAPLNGSFGNPFARSPTRIQSPLSQIPEQTQQNFYSPPTPQTAPPQMSNPFFSQQMQAPQQHVQAPYQMPQQQQMPTPQYMGYQKPDTASILALYNSPNPFHVPGQQTQEALPANQGLQVQPIPENTYEPQNISNHGPGSNNPFMSGGPAAHEPQSAPLAFNSPVSGGARSRDSVMATGLNWTNGRHSPDAFASLSARDMR